MSQQSIRILAFYVFLAICCAAVVTAGCDNLPGRREIETINGQVATEYSFDSSPPDSSDSMFENDTSLGETPSRGEETGASPDDEPDSDVRVEDAENPPIKPIYDLNAGTGSDESVEMENRDDCLRGGEGA